MYLCPRLPLPSTSVWWGSNPSIKYNRGKIKDDNKPEENIYFKVESFVKIGFSCLLEDIRLPVVFLEVATLRVAVQQIDQSIRVLTSLPMKLRLAKVNIEAASSVVDLAVLSLLSRENNPTQPSYLPSASKCQGRLPCRTLSLQSCLSRLSTTI